MFSRISSTVAAAAAFLALPGCGPGAEVLPGDAIECAIGAGSELASGCTLERLVDAGGIVLHHPGGGFRRFRFDAELLKIEPSDGADPVISERSGDEHMVFRVGTDRYRIALALLFGDR